MGSKNVLFIGLAIILRYIVAHAITVFFNILSKNYILLLKENMEILNHKNGRKRLQTVD